MSTPSSFDSLRKVSIPPSGKRTSQNSSRPIAPVSRVMRDPLKSKTRTPFITRSVNASGVAHSSVPPSRSVVSLPVEPLTCTEQLGLNWIKNNAESSSVEERMFVLTFMDCGLSRAAEVAAKFQWRCQRPLRALRAVMNERGKKYSAQNAGRKPGGVVRGTEEPV